MVQRPHHRARVHSLYHRGGHRGVDRLNQGGGGVVGLDQSGGGLVGFHQGRGAVKRLHHYRRVVQGLDHRGGGVGEELGGGGSGEARGGEAQQRNLDTGIIMILYIYYLHIP